MFPNVQYVCIIEGGMRIDKTRTGELAWGQVMENLDAMVYSLP